MDALISIFLAGLMFNICSERREEHEEQKIQEAVAKLFTLPMFVIFGVSLPLGEWLALGWPLLGMAVAVLLLRRPLVVSLIYPLLSRLLSTRDTAYVGWFGPIGIAAIYYSTFASGRIDEPFVWHLASAVIFSSIVLHGVTAAPFTRMYAAGADSHR